MFLELLIDTKGCLFHAEIVLQPLLLPQEDDGLVW